MAALWGVCCKYIRPCYNSTRLYLGNRTILWRHVSLAGRIDKMISVIHIIIMIVTTEKLNSIGDGWNMEICERSAGPKILCQIPFVLQPPVELTLWSKIFHVPNSRFSNCSVGHMLILFPPRFFPNSDNYLWSNGVLIVCELSHMRKTLIKF